MKWHAAVEICTGTAVWYHTALPVVPIRWVLVRDPLGKFPPQVLCTNQVYSPTQILEWFVRRWLLEVTFAEVRAHLGMDSQRQWSDARNRSYYAYFIRSIFIGNYFDRPNTQANFSSESSPNYLVLQIVTYLFRCTCFGTSISMGSVLFQSHLNQPR